MTPIRFTVHAGWHDRRWCPIQVQLPSGVDLDPDGHYVVSDGTSEIQAQVWRREDGHSAIGWIVESLPQHQHREYKLHAGRSTSGTAPDHAGGVQVQEAAEGELVVNIGGRHFTTYRFGAGVVRPYLYPVLIDGDISMTRNWPMLDAPQDSTDHVHHKGIWTAHGEVNGTNNWGEKGEHGWQNHQAFNHVYSGPSAGGFTEELTWTDHARKPVMTETRHLTFYTTPQSIRLFDYQVTLHASVREVTLGDTKEGGLLSVRVPSSMEAGRGQGQIENAYGGRQEAETWGKRAPWCDYSGPVSADGGLWYGICLMDHEENPRHPTHWHVRNYGLMTANCFGLHDFTGDPNRRWDLVIPAGESLTWRYRVLIHRGTAADTKLSDHYHDFAHPPTVEVQ